MENDGKWQPPRHSAGVGRVHFYGRLFRPSETVLVNTCALVSTNGEGASMWRLISQVILGSFAWSGLSRAECYIESAYHSLYCRLQWEAQFRSCLDMGRMYVNRHSVAYNLCSRAD